VVWGTPPARPMKMVDGGPAAVSVMSTSPACTTVKLCHLLPIGSIVPVNVSFVSGTGVGVGVGVVLSQPDRAAHTRASTNTRRMRDLTIRSSRRELHGEREL